MNLSIRTLVLTGVLGLVPAWDAHAQYFLGNYGPWPAIPYGQFVGGPIAGGGYLAGGNTVPGDIGRGLGVAYQGYGDLLVKEAIAARIHDDRARDWNNYDAMVRASILQEIQVRNQVLAHRNIGAQRSLTHQKRNYPTPQDLNRGDSLNLLVAELTAPWVELRGVVPGALRLDSKLVRALPLFSPAVGKSVRLDGAGSQPLDPEFINKVIKTDTLRYSAFQADLRDDRGVPLMELVEFMRAFELRFGKAEDPDQKVAFDKLYRKLMDLRPMMVMKTQQDAPPARGAALQPVRPNAAPSAEARGE